MTEKTLKASFLKLHNKRLLKKIKEHSEWIALIGSKIIENNEQLEKLTKGVKR